MESVLDLTLKPRPKSGIAEELIEQELFLYDPDHQITHCLNGGAAIIWLLFDGTRDLASIAQEIAESYELSEQQVLVEVQETTDQLQSLGLLET